jgi:hypothetical protein
MRNHPDLASTVLAAALLGAAFLSSPWARRAYDGAEPRSAMLAAADTAQRSDACAATAHEPCGTQEPDGEHIEKTTLSR